MSLDDFKKSDLDFDSLINTEKSQKKYPKSSEGLRFLTRNLKVDSDKRGELLKEQSSSVAKTSTDKNTTALPSSNNLQDNAASVAESTIDVNATHTSKANVLKTSIDENTTQSTPTNTVANTSIDKIATDLDLKVTTSATNSFSETSLNNAGSAVQSSEVTAQQDHYSSVDNQTEPKFETHGQDADYQSEITEQITNVVKTSTDKNTTQPTTPAIVAVTSIDEITTQINDDSVAKSSIDIFTTEQEQFKNLKPKQTVAVASIDKNTTTRNQATRITLKGNYTKVSHHILSSFKNLQKSESLIYLYLYRQSYGWNRSTTQMTSIRHVANQLKISTRTVQDSIKTLVQKNFIVSEADSSFKINIITENGISNEVPKNNFLMLDNNFFAFPEEVSITERLVYFYLYRFTFGFGRRSTEALVKTKDISLCLNLSIRRLQDALRGLLSKGLIKRDSEISSLGFIFSVKLPHEIYSEITPTEYVANTSIDTNATAEKSTTDDSATKPVTQTSTDENSTEEFSVNLQQVEEGVANTSMDDNATNKYNKTNTKKSSSERDDDLFNFFVQETKKHSGFSFTISKSKTIELLEMHDTEFLKATFKKMLPVLLRQGTMNPVGLYLNALQKPDSYSVLQKPSTQELADQKRYETMIETREKSFLEEFKQLIDKSVETHWLNVGEEKQAALIAERRSQPGEQVRGFTIPESVIKRSAMENAFWNSHKQAWLQLSAEERQAKALKAKHTIIERVYSKGEGRGDVPETLPEREFLKKTDEIAEKLAMISVHKSKNS